MKKWTALTFLALSFSLSAQAAPQKNAALFYWQAFAMLPDIKGEAKELIKDWEQIEITDKVREEALSADLALSYIHKGSTIPHCDWQINMDAGFSALMPHLGKARLAAQITALKGRILLENGDEETAAATFLAGLALCRHIGSDPILVSFALRNALEDRYYTFLLAHINRFSKSAQQQFKQALMQLEPKHPLRDVLLNEQQLIERSIGLPVDQLVKTLGLYDFKDVLQLLQAFDKTLDDIDPKTLAGIRGAIERINPTHFDALKQVLPLPETKKEAMDLWRRIEELSQSEENKLGKLQPILNGLYTEKNIDLAELKNMARELKVFQKEMIELSTCSAEEFDTKHKVFNQKVAQAGLLVRQFIPDIKTMYYQAEKNIVQRKALLATIHYLEGGKKAFDPFHEGVEVTVKEQNISFSHQRFTLQAPLAVAAPKNSAPLDEDHALFKAKMALKEIAAMDGDEEIIEAIEKELKKVFQGDSHIDLTREEGEKALAIFVPDVKAFIKTWLPILEEANQSEGSARTSAAIVVQMKSPIRPLMIKTMQKEASAFRKVLGKERADYIMKRF